MKEELISFDTAKLAKEAGFDWNTEKFYITKGKLRGIQYYDSTPNNKTINDEWFATLDNEETAFCTAPTQNHLHTWIRAKTNCYISPHYESNQWYYIIVTILPDTSEGINHKDWYLEDGYSTYEKAMEKGLQEKLKLIIKWNLEKKISDVVK